MYFEILKNFLNFQWNCIAFNASNVIKCYKIKILFNFIQIISKENEIYFQFRIFDAPVKSVLKNQNSIDFQVLEFINL